MNKIITVYFKSGAVEVYLEGIKVVIQSSDTRSRRVMITYLNGVTVKETFKIEDILGISVNGQSLPLGGK